jgi:Fusaric acid resistance protein-like
VAAIGVAREFQRVFTDTTYHADADRWWVSRGSVITRPTAGSPRRRGARALTGTDAEHGHPRPFFAPIAAVVSLNGARRLRRAVELVVGVSVGVGVGDLLIAAIGSGAWQISLVVALAMAAAVWLDGGPSSLRRLPVPLFSSRHCCHHAAAPRCSVVSTPWWAAASGSWSWL